MKLKEWEKDAILSTLVACGGNRSKTAQALGIGVRTLQRKLKKYEEVKTYYEGPYIVLTYGKHTWKSPTGAGIRAIIGGEKDTNSQGTLLSREG